ncbi:MAG: hypothetical protein LBH25_10775 [Fibromonadaceae bacterium]|jgi:hypothetical protein|nr:hypothetical protein [Fibromonadaceae bacterium]
MNKIYSLAAMLAMLFSCSGEAQFNEEKHKEILIDEETWIDEVLPNIRGDTLCLEFTSLRELDWNDYLSNFFWIVDSDTIRSHDARKKISYGWHFFELFLIDIWGDTLSHRDSIFYKEPLSFTLLSPINHYLGFSGDTIEFQYKLNGLSEEDEIDFSVLIYEENYSKEDSWELLNGNSYVLNCLERKLIYWKVGMLITYEHDSQLILSETRRIICLEE